MKRLLLPAVVASLVSLAAAQELTFETASIKRAAPDETRRGARGQPGGRLEYYNMTLRMLVQISYDGDTLPTAEQFVGGPRWADEDRFNIVAKAEGNPGFDATRTPRRYRLMQQALLKERFKLRVHTEMRVVDIYALVVASKDGKLGSQLQPSTAECYTSPVPPGQPIDPARRCGLGGPPGNIRGTGVTMSQLVAGFSRSPAIGRPVVDRTGLTGRYNLRLEFVPPVIPGPNPDSPPIPNPAADSGPSVFTAIQEQIGLKLQPEKGPVAFLVIDSAERPTED